MGVFTVLLMYFMFPVILVRVSLQIPLIFGDKEEDIKDDSLIGESFLFPHRDEEKLVSDRMQQKQMRKINKITCVLITIASTICVVDFCLCIYIYLLDDEKYTKDTEIQNVISMVLKRICTVGSAIIIRK